MGQKKRKQVELQPLKRDRLEELVDAAFGVLNEAEQDHEALIGRVYSMPPDLLAIQIADSPQQQKPRSTKIWRQAVQRKLGLATGARGRDEEYKAAGYETAAAAAGIGHDPYMPRPNLAPVKPSRDKSPTEPTCLEKATAHQWDTPSAREISGGLPTLGKRR